MSIIGTLLGTDAAKASKAAAADKYAKEQAAGAAIRGYGDTYAQGFRDLSTAFDPYVAAGRTAVSAYDNLLRDPSSVRSTPGYDFNFNEGQRALDHSGAARGNMFSGKTGKDLVKYGQNYADTFYGNQLQRLMQGTQLGQQATGAQTGLVGTGLQGQLATRQSAYGGDMSSAGTIGQGDIAAENAKSKALQGLLDFGGKIAGTVMGGGMPGFSMTGNPLTALFSGGKQDNPWMVGSPNRIPTADVNF